MGKAKITAIPGEFIKRINSDRKKQAGRTRADFSGVRVNSIGSATGAAGSSTSNIPQFASNGGRISGGLSLYPKTIDVVSGVIDITDETAGTGNITTNTSNVNVIGQGGVADTLVTINGNFDTGQVLFLKAGGTEITLQHGTATDGLYCPGATNYVIGANEGTVLVYGGTGNYWTVIGSTGGTGGSGIANVVEDLTPQLGGNLDAQGYNITNADLIDFQTDVDAWIWGTGTDIVYNVGATDTHNFSVGGSSQFGVDATYVHVLNNILRMRETSTSNTTLEMFADSPTPNDFDTLNTILFKGNDSAGSETIFGRVDAIQNDITNGTEDGEIQIGVTGAGFQGAANLILNHTTLELHRQWSNSLGNGCEMVFHNDDASMNDGQVVGQITMDSNDSSGNQTTYGQMIFSAEDVTNGTEDGGFELKLMKAGTLTSMLKTTISGIDYKVPSGDKHSFYVAGTKIVDVADVGINMYGKDLTFTTGGRINFYDIVGGGSLSAGGGTALPATPTAYFTVEYQGNTRYIPYYSV